MNTARKNQRQRHVGAIQITNLDDEDVVVLDGYDGPTTTPTSSRSGALTNGNKSAATAKSGGTDLFDRSLGLHVMGAPSRDLIREQKMRLDECLSTEHRDVLKPDSSRTNNIIDNKVANPSRKLSEVLTGPKTPTHDSKQNGSRPPGTMQNGAKESSSNRTPDSVANRSSSLLANQGRPVVKPQVNRNQKGFGREERDMFIDDIEDF
ncbi:hypothetical protein DPMN_134765 [Dreissena polymorpha]|uniref:Uncharacterized protein n=1 Tax=Dreissena polymorpha TaxID=45954 RepID=A0A9D4FZL4_DREPO|nr:hypothetical protein DPMN_134765 [Dreissena polymorpha]